jgi:hypothetical protein
MKVSFKKQTVTLPLALLISLGSIATTSYANNLTEEFFLSKKPNQLLANNATRGKPPYNRAARNLARKKQQLLEIELSALEINEYIEKNPPQSGPRKLITTGGHPDRIKRRTIRKTP